MCDFCDWENEVNYRLIAENDLAFAIPIKKPVVEGHIVICSKQHAPTLDQITEEELRAMFDLRKELTKAMQKSHGAKGFNYAWNEVAVAGQSVMHLHIHIMPRRTGDITDLGFDPREAIYKPSSERKTITEEEMKEVAKQIRGHIEQT